MSRSPACSCEHVLSSLLFYFYLSLYQRKEYTVNAKYFCRGQWSECTDRIRTNIKNKWVDSGRFSLFDDTTAAVFTVTFRDLSERDSGTYQCGVDISGIKDSHTEVNLNVVTVLSHIFLCFILNCCNTCFTVFCFLFFFSINADPLSELISDGIPNLGISYLVINVITVPAPRSADGTTSTHLLNLSMITNMYLFPCTHFILST
uniref:Ig-like domain-containing protein n=1 Tax=Sinocyclocheilus rhinocerous TaxID=307959 RepID=A0A673MED0_9TELE